MPYLNDMRRANSIYLRQVIVTDENSNSSISSLTLTWPIVPCNDFCLNWVVTLVTMVNEQSNWDLKVCFLSHSPW